MLLYPITELIDYVIFVKGYFVFPVKVDCEGIYGWVLFINGKLENILARLDGTNIPPLNVLGYLVSLYITLATLPYILLTINTDSNTIRTLIYIFVDIFNG